MTSNFPGYVARLFSVVNADTMFSSTFFAEWWPRKLHSQTTESGEWPPRLVDKILKGESLVKFLWRHNNTDRTGHQPKSGKGNGHNIAPAGVVQGEPRDPMSR